MTKTKKLVQWFLVLGLALNGFCVNLLAPRVAMAMPVVQPVAMHEMEGMEKMAEPPMAHDAMMKTETFTDCVNMDLSVGFNCCFTPNKHGAEKTFESRVSVDHRHPMRTVPMKFEAVDPLKLFENEHFRHFRRYGGFPSFPGLAGQIVKRE